MSQSVGCPPTGGNRLSGYLRHLGLDPDSLKEIYVRLPEAEYGYQKKPLTWDELKHIIEVEGNLAKLTRSEVQQHEYEIFRVLLRQQFKSVVDYILVTKFDYQKRTKNGVWEAFPSLQNSTTTQKRLVPNDFPYCMEKGIVHYVLWKTKDEITVEDIAQARTTLCDQEGVIDSLHWVNPPHLKSLPEIDHVHFLCLMKSGDNHQVNLG